MRVLRAVRRCVCLDPAASRPRFADHQELGDRRTVPSAGLGDLETQSNLTIVRSKHRLLVRDHGLDLDDEHDPGRRVPREEIDRTAFAADPERDLGRNVPSSETKSRRDNFDESSVFGIDQAIKGLAVPVQAQIRSSAKRAGDPISLGRRDIPRLPSLDAYDNRSTDTRGICQVLLTPAASMS